MWPTTSLLSIYTFYMSISSSGENFHVNPTSSCRQKHTFCADKQTNGHKCNILASGEGTYHGVGDWCSHRSTTWNLSSPSNFTQDNQFNIQGNLGNTCSMMQHPWSHELNSHQQNISTVTCVIRFLYISYSCQWRLMEVSGHMGMRGQIHSEMM